MAEAWNAKWISFAYDPRQDLGVFAFRRRFFRASQIRVSADNRYKLYCNGKLVGMGPQRGDERHWFYETYDLTPFLVDGENELIALVWNFGWMAPMAQHTVRTGFVLEDLSVSPPPDPLPSKTMALRGEGETPIFAVLGEMRELGEMTESGHREVGRALVENGVREAILLNAGATGPVHFMAEAAIEAGLPAANIRVASSHEEVRQFLHQLERPAVVLVKGSRGVELERALPFEI